MKTLTDKESIYQEALVWWGEISQQERWRLFCAYPQNKRTKKEQLIYIYLIEN